jgi:hypothetical protein
MDGNHFEPRQMSLTDWLAAQFYTSDDDIATHQQVADAQQAIADRQLSEGKVNLSDYIGLSNDIQAAGQYEADYKKSNSGFFGFLKNLPPWAWGVIVIVSLGLFFNAGGAILVRRFFKKFA